MKKYDIYLWGAGKSEPVIRSLLRENVCINGIIDINAEQIINKNGIEVILPDQIKRFDKIIVTIKNSKSVKDLCKKMGLPKEKIIFVWEEFDPTCNFIKVDDWKKILELEDKLKENYTNSNKKYEISESFPKIVSAKDLLNVVIRERKSVCRFGDGEFEIMRKKDRAWFQKVDNNLSNRLKEIIKSSDSNICLCIADNFGNLNKYTDEAANAIREYVTNPGVREDVLSFLSHELVYYDAYVSRPYMIFRDKKHAEEIFDLWKEVFYNRDVLLVEGQSANSGKNNDLFDGCKNIRRILCPDKNAYDKYDIIYDRIKKKAQKNDLILIRLGPTATVMAYDLAKDGYQAIDIGQLDNEYDWFRLRVNYRVPITGKLVAEVSQKPI